MTKLAALNILDGADGSATYSSNGFTVIASVNGPIEVSRRDEQPEQATLEVNVRPAIGVGSPKDRHLELLLHSTLNRIVSTELFPRSLLQLTLQVLSTPDSSNAPALPTAYAQSTLLLLPALLNAAQLTLLSGAVPLCTTMSIFTALTIRGRQEPLLMPQHAAKWDIDAKAARNVVALHVCAITDDGNLALIESEGDFSFAQWEAVCRAVRSAQSEPASMEVDGQTESTATMTAGRQWLLDIIKQA